MSLLEPFLPAKQILMKLDFVEKVEKVLERSNANEAFV
jgi:hypothetical protein